MKLYEPPRDPRNKKKERAGAPVQPEQSTGRESGDDLTESSPTDIHSDEKVIVNEQRGNKLVNGPSQTAPNTSEGNSNDEEIVN